MVAKIKYFPITNLQRKIIASDNDDYRNTAGALAKPIIEKRLRKEQLLLPQ
jgi:hypothetical protein